MLTIVSEGRVKGGTHPEDAMTRLLEKLESKEPLPPEWSALWKEYRRTLPDLRERLRRTDDLIAIGSQWDTLVENRKDCTGPINLYVENGKLRIESGQESAKTTGKQQH